jgi:DNA-binding NarL/FixJ family response regulator
VQPAAAIVKHVHHFSSELVVIWIATLAARARQNQYGKPKVDVQTMRTNVSQWVLAGPSVSRSIAGEASSVSWRAMGRVLLGSDALRAAIEKIESVRLDGASSSFLPELRQALDLDAIVYTQPVQKSVGWSCEVFEADGVANPTRMRRAINEYLEGTAQPVPWLDLRNPPPEQANRAVDIQALVGSDRYRTSAPFARIIAPTELAEHFVARVLVCDGPNLVGWIGGFSEIAFSIGQLEALSSIATPLKERLRIERLLGSAPRIHAALQATLQQIGAPALLVDARGRVHEMNKAARELLESRRDDVFTSIAAVRAKKAPPLPFTVTRVSANGHPEQFLAVMRPRSPEARMSLLVTLAANRWKLTPRQTEVLRMIVNGDSNAQIAKALGISARATELHVTAIFDRARVESRSQVVAAVLLG